MKKIEITLAYIKSTKGTHVYKNDDSAVPQLYIRKDAFDGEPPKTVTITITGK